MFKPTPIIQGDCLNVMKEFPEGCIDLIYLDPPFFSKKNYDMPFDDDKSMTVFKDSVKEYEEMDFEALNKELKIAIIHPDNDFWKRDRAGLLSYLAYMKARLIECRRVLKPTGSIYLHCDWHASHYLKIIMDEIFGYGNFRNEIVWYYKHMSNVKNDFARKHDAILRYTKTDKYTFNMDEVREPYDEQTIKRYKKPVKFPGGYTAKMNMRGKAPDDVWEIPPIRNVSAEKLGYPTQKPEALLDRIIKASSNPGDIVLDPFCGCGTAVAVANKLKRKFIGIDISMVACTVMQKRLIKDGYPALTISQHLHDAESVQKMNWFEFQEWACHRLSAIPGGKGADRGVDGIGELQDQKDKKKKPIPFLVQVKKWKSSVGDDRIRAFKGAMDNEDTPYGIIVANDFSPKAIQQAEDYNQKGQAHIMLITTQALLKDGFSVQDKFSKWQLRVIKQQYRQKWERKEGLLSLWTEQKEGTEYDTPKPKNKI